MCRWLMQYSNDSIFSENPSCLFPFFAHLLLGIKRNISTNAKKSTEKKLPIGKLKLTLGVRVVEGAKTINLRQFCYFDFPCEINAKRKKIINAKNELSLTENEVKKPQERMFLQITWSFYNQPATTAWRIIIKNPFDIVQLILQLFAPLTELMELAKFPSFVQFLTPSPKVRLSQHRSHPKGKRAKETFYDCCGSCCLRRGSEVNFFNSFRSNSTGNIKFN